MDELAGELHISKKTIYKHFPSKDNLIKEICSFTTSEIVENADQIVEGKEDVVVKFVKLLNLYGGFLSMVSERWFNDISVHAPNLKKEIETRRNDKINNIMLKLLEQGKKEKLIINYPSEMILVVFTSSLKAVLNTDFLVMNRFSMHEAFKLTYEILLNGILTSKGKDKFKSERLKLSKQILI